MTKQHEISWLNWPGYKGETYNPIVGCTKCSVGCQNCYAEKMALRLAAMGLHQYADVMDVDAKCWNGKTAFVESALYQPLRWRDPRCVFPCNMSDLFHESVPFEWIDRVFAVMALCPQHKFLLLTKRVNRMAEYFAEFFVGNRKVCDEIRKSQGSIVASHVVPNMIKNGIKNVGIGVTVCTPDELWKLDELRKIPAAMRFVSFEPLLADLGKVNYEGINWVIVGGESGHNARPMNPDWARSIQHQCADAGVPFFFKQNGGIGKDKGGHLLNGVEYHEFPEWRGVK
jgi:protein gp37